MSSQHETSGFLFNQDNREIGSGSAEKDKSSTHTLELSRDQRPQNISIILDGLDASGKSATSRELAKFFPFIKVQYDSLTQNNEHFERSSSLSDSLEKTNALLMGIMLDIQRNPDLTNLLQVSWALRTAAVAQTLHNLKIDYDPICGLIEQFDHRIGLVVKPEEQLRRLSKRKHEKLTVFDRYLLNNPTFAAELHEAFIKSLTLARFKLIDTSNLTQVEMYQAVREALI